MAQMVANYVKCLQCNEVLQSYHGHDFKTCNCDNRAIADGGLDYQRYGGMDMTKVEAFCITTDDDFEVVRKHMYRAGYGKTGKEAFRVTRLFEMNDNYLEAILVYAGTPEWQKELVKKEQEYRKEHNISIPE